MTTLKEQCAESIGPQEGTFAQLQRYSPPAVNYTPNRWSTFRNNNVDQLRSNWEDDQEKVVILQDRKLGDQEIVMMSRQTFDGVMDPLLELTKGRASVVVDVQLLVANANALRNCMGIVKSLVLENESVTLDENARMALSSAIDTSQAIEIIVQKVSASVVMKNPVSTPDSELTPEERELAESLLREEEEG